MNDFRYGYNDERFLKREWDSKKVILAVIAILFLVGAWFFLNQKLLFGEDWISETYDNKGWTTNEGNLHTNGAWDIETHIWKTEYIVKHFPNFNWCPNWYLGMPLLKYYQSGFYTSTIIISFITGNSLAKSALLFVLFGHLAAVLLTLLLAYKVSGRIFVSALASLFLISSSFITIRSYGWEPISVAFLFLYPLVLLIFLRQPLRPFRFWLVLLLGITYLAHPLIWFSLNMTMGIYLLTIAIRKRESSLKEDHPHYLWKFLALVFFSLLIGAIQFLPQYTYGQVTSGAHMGVTYLPFYHVKYNVVRLFDFLLDAGNLKGPGFTVFVAFAILILFALINKKKKLKRNKTICGNELVAGFLTILVAMVLFYYAEKYNIFPMNILRSIQYHRTIPEIIIVSVVLTASMSNLIRNHLQKSIYYGFLIAFTMASFIVIYNTQLQWQTTDTISDKPEFIYDNFEGRISFPYTEQSLSVRNSFTEIPQVYGYYEQGITNPYADELFSVSSGFHDLNVTLIYLEAANVGRLYINKEEGERNKIIFRKFSGYFDFTEANERYGYFDLNLKHPELARGVSSLHAKEVLEFEPGCRTMFREVYCGSKKEEFVTTDYAEQRYLQKYLDLIEEGDDSNVKIEMINPQHYSINVSNATIDTAIVVKMTHDSDFTAKISDEEIEIDSIGPDFMLISPGKEGEYEINLVYHVNKTIKIGAFISLGAILLLVIISLYGTRTSKKNKYRTFSQGDLENDG